MHKVFVRIILPLPAPWPRSVRNVRLQHSFVREEPKLLQHPMVFSHEVFCTLPTRQTHFVRAAVTSSTAYQVKHPFEAVESACKMPPKRSLMMKNLRKHSQSTEPPSSPRPTREEADIALFNGIELLGRRYPERDFAIATCVLNHIEDDILAYFRRDGVECDRHLYEELELLAEARRRQLVRVRRNRGVHTGLDDYVSGRDNFSMPAYGTSAAKPVYIEDDEDVEDYGPVGEEGGFEVFTDEDDVDLRPARELGSIEDAGEEDESESLVDEERSTRRRNRRLAEAPISSSHYWAEDDLEGMSAEDDSYSDYGQEYSKPASDGDYSEPASDGDDMETLSEEDDSDSQFYEDMIIGEIFDKGGPSTRGGVRPAEAPIHRPRYVPRDERIDKVTGEIWHADCPDNFPFGETRFMENYIGYTFSRDLAAGESKFVPVLKQRSG